MADTKQSFGGSWTAEKLSRLEKYLQAYVRIMKNQEWCEYCYIDAFAGTGYNTPKETISGDDIATLLPEVAAEDNQEFLDSSVRIALKVDPPFKRYVFIEKSEFKAAELHKLKEEFPEIAGRIEPTIGDANAELQRICETWNWKKRRAVLFLDPFGMQVTWSTLEAIARTNAIDMWLLFPAGIGVNRLFVRDGRIPESWCRRLDAFLGVSESVWRSEFYKTEATQDLFGEMATTEKVASIQSIGRFFNQRLKTIFEQVASNPLELRNDFGTSLYLLCFASKNATALRISSHILKG